MADRLFDTVAILYILNLPQLLSLKHDFLLILRQHSNLTKKNNLNICQHNEKKLRSREYSQLLKRRVNLTQLTQWTVCKTILLFYT